MYLATKILTIDATQYVVRNVVSKVVDALAQLHAMRIVHTDIKLDNLFGSSL